MVLHNNSVANTISGQKGKPLFDDTADYFDESSRTTASTCPPWA